MTSKQTHSRPSQLLCLDDAYAAYQFDAAVTSFGLVIENALHETREVGAGKSKKTVAKYKLHDLLDDKFQFSPENGLSLFKSVDGYEEVS